MEPCTKCLFCGAAPSEAALAFRCACTGSIALGCFGTARCACLVTHAAPLHNNPAAPLATLFDNCNYFGKATCCCLTAVRRTSTLCCRRLLDNYDYFGKAAEARTGVQLSESRGAPAAAAARRPCCCCEATLLLLSAAGCEAAGRMCAAGPGAAPMLCAGSRLRTTASHA